MGVPLDVFIHNAVRLPHLFVEQVACCGRVGEEVKLGSRYSLLLTNTCVVCLRLERYTLMFREQTISSDVCPSQNLWGGLEDAWLV